MPKKLYLLLLPILLALACSGFSGDDTGGDEANTSGFTEDPAAQCAPGAVEIEMVYAPESDCT
jgi:hypothetical protein